MTINTKFKIGDTIAFIDTKTMTLHEDIITSVSTYTIESGQNIFYGTKDGSVSESDARASRDEILESLNRPF